MTRIELGEEVTWRARHFGARLRASIMTTSSPRMARGGTVMRDVFEFAAPCGMLGLLAERLVLTSYLRRFLAERNRQIKAVAESDAWRKFV